VTSCFVFGISLTTLPIDLDVLLGDFEGCVEYNLYAIRADRRMMEHIPNSASEVSLFCALAHSVSQGYQRLNWGILMAAFVAAA
jgi:hypothetical protein